MSGTATELAHPDREPVTFFTNRDGRFGIVGLAPGEWRLQTVGTNKQTYVLRIAEGADTASVGDLSPGS